LIDMRLVDLVIHHSFKCEVLYGKTTSRVAILAMKEDLTMN